MRELSGHVDLLGLGNLLQLLAVNKCEGFLTVKRGHEEQTIHLSEGGIRLLASTAPRIKRVARLARIVMGPSPILPEQLKKILKGERLLGWTLGHLALANTAVSKQDVEGALRQQVEEEILDMFVWTEAHFEFVEGRAPGEGVRNPLARLALRANVTSLLLEAARRADEVVQMRRTLVSDDLRLHKLPFEIHADELGEDVVRVDAILPLIDGRRTLRTILEASIYPRFATMRAVHRLLTLGYIKVHDRQGQNLLFSGPAPPA
jgi:hypothetical protein